jgi:type III secretory pathway component EscV
MFYVLIFSILAVVLIVGGLTTMSRRRKNLEYEETHAGAQTRHGDTQHRARKAKRAQSQHDRRKRH